MGRNLPLSLGILSLVSTIALICDGIILSVHSSSQSLVRTTSLISASLEATVLAALAWFVTTVFSNSFPTTLKRCSLKRLMIAFGCGILACLVAAAASVANVVCLGRATDELDGDNKSKGPFLVASSLILGITLACQLVFLIVYYIACQRRSQDGAESFTNDDELRLPGKTRVKSIPYSRTRPSLADSRGMYSTESVDLGFLEGQNSSPVQAASSQQTLSQWFRPTTSRTRLLSTKEQHRPPSLDSNAYRDSFDDGNDAWDASSGHSRHTAQAISSPTFSRSRTLETIPASPRAAENPSFDSAWDLEPPAPVRQLSRSYSPATPSPRQMTSSPNGSSDELNIHPLFRSDSPTPPPVATPGTSVVAAPDAGKLIAHRPSNQSLRQARASSVASSSSPLSRSSSFEASSLKKPRDEQDSIREVDEDIGVPPIPEFVLGAGSRSSLTRYSSRKMEMGAV